MKRRFPWLSLVIDAGKPPDERPNPPIIWVDTVGVLDAEASLCVVKTVTAVRRDPNSMAATLNLDRWWMTFMD